MISNIVAFFTSEDSDKSEQSPFKLRNKNDVQSVA